MAGQTLAQRTAAAELKANELRARLSKQQRSDDTRRKIVIGGTILAAMADDADLRGRVLHQLRERVKKPNDLVAIADLLNQPSG